MAENRQKIKLIKLYELLRKETDEDHPTAYELHGHVFDGEAAGFRRPLSGGQQSQHRSDT